MSNADTLRVRTLRERTAEEIRALLARRRLSATQLARQMGISQAYIWRRLSGETAFDLDDLEKISVILNVEIIDLLPPAREGRLITVAAPLAETVRTSNDRSMRAPDRPLPTGRPSPASPDESTRRPVRVRSALAS